MSAVLNISAYLFVTLNDTAELRAQLHAEAASRGLKGTVLIAPEGINLFLAGPAEAVRGWVAVLKADPRFATLAPKESWSQTVPFKKLLVKVKGEIIRMNRPTIRPDAVGEAGRAPAVEPAVLRQWLSQGHDGEGRPVVTLDTRNAFEVAYGTFAGAIDWGIGKFSEFPQAVQRHKAELQGKTVVSFCTGGIRCEKAALYLQEAGVSHVYQLEGGILKYFELTDGAHWQGDCFVFDEREALGANLTVGASAQASRADRANQPPPAESD